MRIKASHVTGQRKTWWIVLFLAGIFLALLFGDAYMTDNPLGTYHLNALANRATDSRELFVTILWERGKFFIILALFCTGVRRHWMDKWIPVLLLFGLGLYGGVCLACQGFWGIGIFLLSLFPHGVVYLFVIYVIVHKKKPVQYSGKRYILTEIVSVLFLLGMIFAGCFLEATVGSYLLQHYCLAFISAIS